MSRINTWFYLRKGVIYCRVSYQGTRSDFSTGIKTSPEHFENGRITSKLESELDKADQMAEISYKIKKTNVRAGYTARTIVDLFLNRKTISQVPLTLITMMEHTVKAKENDPDISLEGVEYYRRGLNKLKKWLKTRSMTDMDIHSTYPIDIQDYNSWMRNSEGLAPKTAQTYIDALNGAIEFCIKSFITHPEMIRNNPLANSIKLSRKERRKMRKKTIDNCLTLEQVRLIKDAKFEGHTRLHKIPLEWYRLTALWQVFTGFSYSDLGNEWDIIPNINGDKFIVMDRIKTGEECSIPLMDHTKELIDRLMEIGDDRMFPVPNFNEIEDEKKRRSVYNKEYKRYNRFVTEELSKIVGKRITTHTFRHTFGMLGLNYFGYPVDEVAKMMGHKTSKTTLDNYARKTIDGMTITKKAI